MSLTNLTEFKKEVKKSFKTDELFHKLWKEVHGETYEESREKFVTSE